MSKSFVTMSSKDVNELCDKTINYFHDYQQKIIKSYIDRCLKVHNESFFTRFFGKKMTYEEMLEFETQVTGLANNIHCFEMYGIDNISVARRLKTACKHAEIINISIDDLHKISS